jgi:hypothetical protein
MYNLLNEITIGDRPAKQNHEWWVNLNEKDLEQLPDPLFKAIVNRINDVAKTRIERTALK